MPKVRSPDLPLNAFRRDRSKNGATPGPHRKGYPIGTRKTELIESADGKSYYRYVCMCARCTEARGHKPAAGAKADPVNLPEPKLATAIARKMNAARKHHGAGARTREVPHFVGPPRPPTEPENNPTSSPWMKIRLDLKKQIAPEDYKNWIKPTEFLGMAGDDVVAWAPDQVSMEWIQRECGKLMKGIIAKLNLPVRNVLYKPHTIPIGSRLTDSSRGYKAYICMCLDCRIARGQYPAPPGYVAPKSKPAD